MISSKRMMPALAAGLLAGASLLPVTAQADDSYPKRPVSLVVGYAAGGATDIVARLIAKPMAEALKQPVVVENRAGANSNIGAEYVARSDADGYTLYIGSIANTINNTLYEKLNYNVQKDFKPVALLSTIPNILVVHPDLPIRSVQDYIDYAKKNPGKLTCASSGTGSSIHMTCELFKLQTDTDILHVPYRGSGPAVADLLGGQVDSMFDNLPSSLPHVKAGKLRALGISAAERAPFAPDVPTLAESGLPGFAVQSWFAVMAPAGTPDAIVNKLNKVINDSLQSEEIRTAYNNGGFVMPTGDNTPADLKNFVDAEVKRWAEVVTSAGVKVQ